LSRRTKNEISIRFWTALPIICGKIQISAEFFVNLIWICIDLSVLFAFWISNWIWKFGLNSWMFCIFLRQLCWRFWMNSDEFGFETASQI
jgi:hypothetical protein